MRVFCIPLAAAALLSACSQYSEISEVKPVFRPFKTAVTGLANIERQIETAGKATQPLASLGDYLAAAQAAERQLQQHPADKDARNSYNFAVSRVFSVIRKAKLDPWAQPLEVPTPNGTFVLDHRPDKRKAWYPGLYDFTPTDEIHAKGIYVNQHMLKDGLGATLVAVGKEENADARKNFSIPRVYYGVTALANFQGNRCTLSFHDPLETEDVTLDGHSYPLAADFTMPLAVMLANTNPKEMELSRLLRPEKYAETARISRLQPYDPDKTVVLVIHGLKDSPATWAPMINSLRADKKIRQNYQFWFYSYPSGYAYPYSAAILRRQLDGVEAKYRLNRKMVVIGHSMGGCISRLLITDADQKLWHNMFGKPPEQVTLSPHTKELCEESLIFKHRPEVGRVIFISAPLKGADMASGWVGRFSSWLIKAPFTVLNAGDKTIQALATSGDSLKLNGLPNSVDTLAPNNRFVQQINKIPLTPGIPYHTIMGDRGKGGNHDKTPPVQSDGIVPYWSSHMEGAQSELVVPSHHSAHQNPQAIAEVARILKTYTPGR